MTPEERAQQICRFLDGNPVTLSRVEFQATVEKHINDAVSAERARCAKLAREYPEMRGAREGIAAAIERGEAPGGFDSAELGDPMAPPRDLGRGPE